jgi:hypothetical protein
MKKLVMGVLVLLTGAVALCGQELSQSEKDAVASTNVAAPFENTSAAHANLLAASDDATPSWSFANSATPVATPPPAAFPDPASPQPKIFFGDRDDYRWQLYVGAEFFRFQSNVIDASMVGLNTDISYFTNDWFAFEGSVVTGFAPEIYTNDHVKYVGLSGGVRVGARRARWEPWGHALFGWGHLQPQTADGSRNSVAITVGGGVDFRIFARLSWRAEMDYVFNRFFSEHQNNFQATTGVVLHF